MNWTWLETWLADAPMLWVGGVLFAIMAVAAAIGSLLGERKGDGDASENDGQEGYVVSAVLGLLALLMGFTFSLAVDRFETRRVLVLREANAIGTTYLRAQLLPEPHRARVSGLLVQYIDNRLALAKAVRGPEGSRLLARNDAIVTDLWTATAAAFPSIKHLDFSSVFLETMNNLIDLDAARKAARNAHVPTEVFAVLFAYLAMTAGVLGYVMKGARGRLSAAFLLCLLTLSLLLIVDIDRPLGGGIVEGQGPMERLRKTIAAQPPEVFDRWTAPTAEDPPRR
ncbi:MAG: hypothetical protein ACREE0_11170 [Phenylobacterium sp.]